MKLSKDTMTVETWPVVLEKIDWGRISRVSKLWKSRPTNCRLLNGFHFAKT